MNSLTNIFNFISQSLDELTNSWSNYLRKEFKLYYSNASWKSMERSLLVDDSCNSSFWLIIPKQLFEKYQNLNIANMVNLDFLYNTLWSQYCIFMSIRIRDDILDSSTKKNSLFLISDLFMIESEKILSNYFSHSTKFWELFNFLKLETLTAMHEKEYLELKSDSDPELILECHGLEGAVLNIAVAAICCKFNRLEDYYLIKKYIYNLVIAGQIIDDLFDIEEDLNSGYYNYVLRYLFPTQNFKTISEKKIPGSVFRSILDKNKINSIVHELNSRIALAEFATEHLQLQIFHDNVKEYKNYILNLEQSLNRRMVEILFHNQFGGLNE